MADESPFDRLILRDLNRMSSLLINTLQGQGEDSDKAAGWAICWTTVATVAVSNLVTWLVALKVGGHPASAASFWLATVLPLVATPIVTWRFLSMRQSLRRVRIQLHQLSNVDVLTQLLSRHRFIEVVSDGSLPTCAQGVPQALLLLNLDGFKQVNGAYGQAVGDELLRAVAKRLADGFGARDPMARWGGDEFIVALVSEPLETASAMAARARQFIEDVALSLPDGRIVRVSASIGLAWRSRQEESLDALTFRAEAAMGRAKQAGRNRVIVDIGLANSMAPIVVVSDLPAGVVDSRTQDLAPHV